jgi:transposase
MPKAYSLDLRERVARFVESGRSRHVAAAHFQVSVSFVVNLMKALKTSGRLEAKPRGGRQHAKLDPHRDFLIARVTEKADITMVELAAELVAATGTAAEPASLSRFLIRNGYRFKKNLAGKRARPARHQGSPRGLGQSAPALDAA